MGGLSALASAGHPEDHSGKVDAGWLIGKGGRAAHATQNPFSQKLDRSFNGFGQTPTGLNVARLSPEGLRPPLASSVQISRNALTSGL